MIIFFDLIIVVFLIMYLIRNNQLDLQNSSFLYLIIHLFFVTFKGFQIFILDSKITSNSFYDSFIKLEDISYAIAMADISLIGFFIGFNFLKKSFVKRGKKLKSKFVVIVEERQRLMKFYLSIVVVFGFLGLLLYSFIPGIKNEEIEATPISIILSSLGIISSVILLYEYGFKVKFLFFFGLMVFIYSIQGSYRYRVILPLLFVALYYIKINNLKLLPKKFALLSFIFILLSFPLKEIGQVVQSGGNVDIIEITSHSFDEFLSGNSSDLQFIEQSAAMISNIDSKEIVFYGRTYVPILLFWIPRDFWPDKPRLNDWQYEISTSGRNFGEMGQISLISGESYANFRIFGVFFIPFFIGRFYSYLYYSYSDLPHKHKGFLLLLIFNMILFQTWRDGLISLFLFPLLNYLPLLVLYFIKKPKSSSSENFN